MIVIVLDKMRNPIQDMVKKCELKLEITLEILNTRLNHDDFFFSKNEVLPIVYT